MKQAIVVWVSIAMGYVAGVQQGKIEVQNNFESKYPIGSTDDIPEPGPITTDPDRYVGRDLNSVRAEMRGERPSARGYDD